MRYLVAFIGACILFASLAHAGSPSSSPSMSAVTSAITSANTDDVTKRAGLTSLAGTTYAEVVTATTVTVVSAAANTGGIIIRIGATQGSASSVEAAILVDDNPILRSKGFSAFNYGLQIKDIFVPAGSSLKLYSSAITAQAFVWYEAL